MKNIINIWAVGLLVTCFTACSPEEAEESALSNFETELPAPEAVVEAQEYDGNGVYTINFTLTELQFTDVHLVVEVGASTTATEGVDFDLITSSVDLIAFEGLDGFSVQVQVYEDSDFDENDETIFIKLVSDLPSGVSNSEVQVVTIPKWPTDCVYDIDNGVGDLTGIDVTIDGLGQDPYESEGVLSGTSGSYMITGLGVGWMTDFWGEVITNMNEVEITFSSDDYYHNATIASQTYMETTYNGAPQDPYLIEGTGTLSKCGKILTIEYSLTNFGVDWAAWTHDNGYMSEEKFTAVINLP
ncbi:hypothetical protein [Reichenbachiella faecimaris]|nr:hypothetical protein [Reichenbachiella faecimaris]